MKWAIAEMGVCIVGSEFILNLAEIIVIKN